MGRPRAPGDPRHPKPDLRSPVPQIDQSPWGMVIRLIEVAAAILGIYWGGSAADWW
jgi:hypothetical protein